MPSDGPLTEKHVEHGHDGRISKPPMLDSFRTSRNKKNELSNHPNADISMFQALKEVRNQANRRFIMCKIVNFFHPKCWLKKPKKQTSNYRHLFLGLGFPM